MCLDVIQQFLMLFQQRLRSRDVLGVDLLRHLLANLLLGTEDTVSIRVVLASK